MTNSIADFVSATGVDAPGAACLLQAAKNKDAASSTYRAANTLFFIIILLSPYKILSSLGEISAKDKGTRCLMKNVTEKDPCLK
jgi:hypothetical protein